MKIYILMFDDKIERASCDSQKIHGIANESNGYDECENALDGPYFVIDIELEDVPHQKLWD